MTQFLVPHLSQLPALPAERAALLGLRVLSVLDLTLDPSNCPDRRIVRSLLVQGCWATYLINIELDGRAQRVLERLAARTQLRVGLLPAPPGHSLIAVDLHYGASRAERARARWLAQGASRRDTHISISETQHDS